MLDCGHYDYQDFQFEHPLSLCVRVCVHMCKHVFVHTEFLKSPFTCKQETRYWKCVTEERELGTFLGTLINH